MPATAYPVLPLCAFTLPPQSRKSARIHVCLLRHITFPIFYTIISALSQIILNFLLLQNFFALYKHSILFPITIQIRSDLNPGINRNITRHTLFSVSLPIPRFQFRSISIYQILMFFPFHRSHSLSF